MLKRTGRDSSELAGPIELPPSARTGSGAASDDDRRPLWPRLAAIVEHALLLDPEEQRAYLDRQCSHSEIRFLAERLIEADRRAEEFLETPAWPGAAMHALVACPGSLAGQSIGAYRLLEPLGAGGIGEVYLAAGGEGGTPPRVAVKVLHVRPRDDDAKRRLVRERRILARLSHPGIARLYDGGETEDGRPYLVMEYVDGLPIDVYCQRRALGLDARLELFSALCEAVQHAHQNLVVHRDLKPGNVLVTADGSLKLLDFSIAKDLEPGLGPGTAHTVTGHRPMTLAYASPEQILGEPITPATDVHGLGVILYVLLTGSHPFAYQGLPIHLVAAEVCGRDPVPPSWKTRAQRNSAAAEAVARETTAARFDRRLLSPNLDAIAVKALQKKPGKRYASVQQLIDDLARHRVQRPVRARECRALLRLRLVLAHHRKLVTTGAVVLAVLILSMAALYQQVRNARRDARRAAAEARTSKEVTEFLVGVFQIFDPSQGRGATVTARELLDRSLERARSDLSGQPVLQRRVLHAIGLAYLQLGLVDEAALAPAVALGLQEATHGPVSVEAIRSLNHLARLRWAAGDVAAAGQLYQRALQAGRTRSDPLVVAESLQGLAAVSWSLGRLEAAEGRNREALTPQLSDRARTELDSIATILMIAQYQRSKLDDAEVLLREEGRAPGDEPDRGAR